MGRAAAGQGMERGNAGRARRVLLAPLGVERDRVRRAGLPARLRAAGRRSARELGGGARVRDRPGRRRQAARSCNEADPPRSADAGSWSAETARQRLRVPARPSIAGRSRPARMAATTTSDEVDLVIVGCGAGGGTLAQRLARKGWRVVVLEAGPFWDPDRDWVSDEAGSHDIYWTEERIIGGADPVELGKNNSGRGVGGSMVHYAGYCPRFHPSDFEVRTRDGVGADWPISYADLRRHYERLELELPVAGRLLALGRPAPVPAHRPSDRRRRRPGPRGCPQARNRDAGRAGRDRQRHVRQPPPLHLPRFLPAGLQGQRQGLARWSPTSPTRSLTEPRSATHCMATRIEVDEGSGRVTGVTYVHERPRALPARRRSCPVPAIRSRRPGCCCTRPAAGSPTASPTATTRSAAT